MDRKFVIDSTGKAHTVWCREDGSIGYAYANSPYEDWISVGFYCISCGDTGKRMMLDEDFIKRETDCLCEGKKGDKQNATN